VNEIKLNQQLNETDWKYLFIEGSSLGNTSFLFSFLKNVLFIHKDFSSAMIDRLVGEEINVLYLRSKPLEKNKEEIKKIISEISQKVDINTVFTEEAFNYRDVLKILCNDRYSHIIIDDVRSEYGNEPFLKFNEVMNFCENEKIKLIVSTTHNKQQKIDYSYFQANLIFNIHPYLLQGIYRIEIEDRFKNNVSSFLIEMK